MIVVEYSPGSTARIANSNLLFTEISGYPRSELYDKDLSVIAPQLFRKAETMCLLLGGEQKEKEKECFLNHKFGHLVPVTYEAAAREEGNWNVVFKLSPSSNGKMIILADDVGRITDYNLVALNGLRELLSSRNLRLESMRLTDLGIEQPNPNLLRKQSGQLVCITVGGREVECLLQTEPIMAVIGCEEDELEEEDASLVSAAEKAIGWKVTLGRYDRKSYNSEASLSFKELIVTGVENQFDQGVLELYDNPNALDVLFSRLAETRNS
jgi:hypothetical protein